MTEKELLRIVETLKDFQKTPLGHEIEVFTDHKNLTYEMIQSSYQNVHPYKSII